MTRSRFGELEVLSASPPPPAKPDAWQQLQRLFGHHRQDAPAPARPPLLFVHGAYTAAWCWQEYFLPWFAAQGFECHALSLSGHGHSRQRAALDAYGIDDYVKDVAEVVAALPSPPVLVGHSMGGMVVQKYLETATVPGVVLMASVPPHGLWSSAFGLLLSKPMLLQDMNQLFTGEGPASARIGDALFHNLPGPRELRRYARLAQPESSRAIWDMTCFNLPRRAAMNDVPMLVLGAEFDAIIPPPLVQHTAEEYGVEARIFPNMGHGMMLEPAWADVAGAIVAWMQAEGLA